jgi:hypothetical protein
MANGRNLTVYLTSDVSRFRKGLKQAEGNLDRFKRIAGGALAGVAAAAGTAAVAFGVEGVKAAADDEKASKRLAKTMENLGKAQDVDKAEDFIDALMKQTGVADDELRPAFEKLVQATGDTDSALQLLAGALDTSIGAGKPLESVAGAIAKAFNGQVGALERLVPGLDDAAIKADPLVGIFTQLNKRFGGQAISQADTYGGKMAAISTAFGELQESFGKGLLESLQGTGDSMGDMDQTLYDLGPAMEDLGTTFGDIATALGETLKYLGPVVEKFNELNQMGDGILTNGTLAQAMKGIAGVRYLAGTVTGNDAAAAEAWSDYNGGNVANGGDFAGANPYEQYRPMRYSQRAIDAKGRADGRAAQTGARTRARP